MRYAKFLVAAVTAAAAAVASAITDGAISGQEWLLIIVAALGAVGVYLTPNSPPVE